MPRQKRTAEAWDWRQVTSLGEQLRHENSLRAQRDRIISLSGRLIEGQVDLWLKESVFRLPDWDSPRVFPPNPPKGGMRLAIQSGKLTTQKLNRATKRASRLSFAAVPLADQGISFGALQITRPKGPAFTRDELNLLKGLAQIVGIGLFASHRTAVEQFRLRQLNLVRAVSAQIASVMRIDELSRRVTELIQKTFNFYYVAIFTVDSNSEALRFRASASASRRGRKKLTPALDVQLGQGLIGEAAAKGEQLISADVRADPRYRFIDSLPETKSEVALPLKIEDRVLGVLDVQSDRANAFHPNDLLILGALADNVTRAVESASLYSSLRRRADQLTLVSEISKTVTSTLNLKDIMREAAALLHERFKFPHVALYTVHPNRRLIAFEAGSGQRAKKMQGFTFSLDAPKGIMVWTARLGKTLMVNDVLNDDRYLPSPLPPHNTRSELCVPLIFEERVVGLLDIQSNKPNSFREEDQLMFEAVGDAMAAAIRNADLYRSEQWRRQTADSLRDVAGLISTNAGVDEVLESILSELDRNLPIDLSAIWLLEDGELQLRAVSGADATELESVCATDPTAAYALAEALVAGAPVIRRPEHPMWPGGLASNFADDYSSIAAPLRVGDRPLGVLTLEHHAAGRYGHEAVAIATTFASYAAVAIENARLYDAAQEQAYASAALLQVAQAVVSLGDLNEILESIIRIMPILVGVERVAVFNWDAERDCFRSSHSYGFSAEEGSPLMTDELTRGTFPLLDLAREENHIVSAAIAQDAAPSSWPRILPEVRQRLDSSASGRLLLAVPLSIKNDMYGVMLVEEAADGRRFRERRLEIINGIAQQAALAIQNDRLQQQMVERERLETEAQLARQVQLTFIPEHLPVRDSWELAARWRTARHVGGDFYDVIELSEHKLGLFIADVADKGMPAALFMALTRTLVRAAIKEMESPAGVLHRVNAQLLPDTQQGMFITAVYGVLDTQRGEFTFVNAGHNPPLHVAASGEIQRLTRTAIALGAVEQLEFKERTIQMGSGDLLLLYTDGVTESWSPDGELFGEGRLIEALQTETGHSAEAVLDRVEKVLGEFSQTPTPADDITLLAVHRL